MFDEAAFRALSQDEMLAIKRSGHRWTPEERGVLFGDSSPDFANRHGSYENELIRRLDCGEYLTKCDRKYARRLKRERAQ